MKAACKELGFEFVENQKTYAWYGTFVGDSPMPQGMTVKDLGKCDHAIRVPGAWYEIGLKKFGDHYEILYDYWESGGLKSKIGTDAAPVKAAYSKAATRKFARKKRFRIAKEERLEDRTRIRIRA
jgi:hypothetical protein